MIGQYLQKNRWCRNLLAHCTSGLPAVACCTRVGSYRSLLLWASNHYSTLRIIAQSKKPVRYTEFSWLWSFTQSSAVCWGCNFWHISHILTFTAFIIAHISIRGLHAFVPLTFPRQREGTVREVNLCLPCNQKEFMVRLFASCTARKRPYPGPHQSSYSSGTNYPTLAHVLYNMMILFRTVHKLWTCNWNPKRDN